MSSVIRINCFSFAEMVNQISSGKKNSRDWPKKIAGLAKKFAGHAKYLVDLATILNFCIDLDSSSFLPSPPVPRPTTTPVLPAPPRRKASPPTPRRKASPPPTLQGLPPPMPPAPLFLPAAYTAVTGATAGCRSPHRDRCWLPLYRHRRRAAAIDGRLSPSMVCPLPPLCPLPGHLVPAIRIDAGANLPIHQISCSCD